MSKTHEHVHRILLINSYHVWVQHSIRYRCPRVVLVVKVLTNTLKVSIALHAISRKHAKIDMASVK